MWFGIVSLFPEMFTALNVGVTGKAIHNGLININIWNPRDFTQDKHKSVDDYAYGGGPGMVMMPGPLKSAIHAAKFCAATSPTVIYLSPQGKQFNQAAAMQLAEKRSLVLIAGRYEGVDERIIVKEVDEEWSIGDFILSGGELPAMVLIDTIARLIPGVVGDEESVNQDSFATGLLKYPQYTRPCEFDGTKVPPVLINGNHELTRKWRLQQALGRTWLNRPDLLALKSLTTEESTLLKQFIEEFSQSNLEK